MGFFNFHKKTELLAPMTGRVIPLEKVPDAVFSQKTLGEGAAIMPEDGLVTAPCDGTIAYVPDTKHAIALTSTKGVEVLIHVGIDTVSLQGEGFDALVKEGDSVSRGQGLLQVDLSLLASKKMNPVTPLVVTGGAASITLLQKEGTRVESGKDAIVSVKEEGGVKPWKSTAAAAALSNGNIVFLSLSFGSLPLIQPGRWKSA